jgi:acyl carrier protein
MDEALVIPVRLDTAALRAQARTGVLPALLRGLVRVPSRRVLDGAGGGLAGRLASVSESEREGVVLEFVQAEVATVLGHISPGTVQTQRAFKDLGFDSLAAVELKNRLSATTGLRLSATLIFDHPTPSALAQYLLSEVVQDGTAIMVPVDAELDKLERTLSAIDADDEERTRITVRLQAFLSDWVDTHRPDGVAEKIHSASDDELFEFLDKQTHTSSVLHTEDRDQSNGQGS